MKNVLLKIEYDGTSYHGWQKQTNTETIEQSIQSVLGIIFQSEITLRACSRTDAGVHAKGQLATISIPDDFPLQRLFSSVNSLLPPDISIVDIVEVGSDFLIKNENTGKRYIYRVNNSSVRMAIGRNYYWWVKRKFDLAPMQLAASNLVELIIILLFGAKDVPRKISLRPLLSRILRNLIIPVIDISNLQLRDPDF